MGSVELSTTTDELLLDRCSSGAFVSLINGSSGAFEVGKPRAAELDNHSNGETLLEISTGVAFVVIAGTLVVVGFAFGFTVKSA